jgi:LPPG:FO 2-phospho-L-lactate transferase
VTARLASAFGIGITLLPATDDRLRTLVETQAGTFSFQEWFVARGHRDPVDGLDFAGADTAVPAPGVLEALDTAAMIVIAPSNPFVSIGPVLAVPAIREALEQRRVPAVAVSPLIGGRAVKGPAAAMMTRLAGGTAPAHVARCYDGLIDALVIDEADAEGAADADVRTIVTRTLMDDAEGRLRVAEAALEGAGALR